MLLWWMGRGSTPSHPDHARAPRHPASHDHDTAQAIAGDFQRLQGPSASTSSPSSDACDGWGRALRVPACQGQAAGMHTPEKKACARAGLRGRLRGDDLSLADRLPISPNDLRGGATNLRKVGCMQLPPPPLCRTRLPGAVQPHACCLRPRDHERARSVALLDAWSPVPFLPLPGPLVERPRQCAALVLGRDVPSFHPRRVTRPPSSTRIPRPR